MLHFILGSIESVEVLISNSLDSRTIYIFVDWTNMFIVSLFFCNAAKKAKIILDKKLYLCTSISLLRFVEFK